MSHIVIHPTGQRIRAKLGEKLGRCLPPELGFDMPCGGVGKCGGCRVRAEGALSEPTEQERKILGGQGLEMGMRLACQATVLGDCVVDMGHGAEPPRPKTHLTGLDTEALLNKAYPLDPGRGTGIAVDIGTTTIALYLVDLASGEMLASASGTNPQVSRGSDVISRITYAMDDPSGCHLRELAELVRGEVARLSESTLRGLTDAESASRGGNDVRAAAVVGNSCMTALFLGLDPSPLGRAPYVAPLVDPVTLRGGRAAELGLPVAEAGWVYVGPGIGSYVGADTVAVTVACEPEAVGRTWMAVDIGTNGEVVLSAGGELMACSTAAGPAFEGGEISCGMRAKAGAIFDVRIEDPETVSVSTIGDREPVGVCGSGLLRAIDEMLRAGLLDASGRLRSGKCGFAREGLVLARPQGLRPVTVTQMDVRQFQLAKAAIRTGIDILMELGGVRVEDLDVLFLAGAFGNHLDPAAAIRTGLLPPVAIERIRPVGNAAGTGAQLLVLSERARMRAAEVRASCRHINLSEAPGFQERFFGNLVLSGAGGKR